ncbi:ferritin-like protein [Chitinophaga niastensis]|uniref:Ferritin-like protein n=1 Tax=Chitinophaga niastensis TaxID=536980 RepID=A0A2P8HP74_CHINA|nr:ferritin-like protein [Chitinophaga niastensis]PSL48023.1 ferritin-like protein [Chitinophaga niastensis]
MQRNYQRFLGPVFKRARIEERRQELNRQSALLGGKEGIHTFYNEELYDDKQKIIVPPEFNGKDYVTFLLHIDAEIEHGLMLQYLYAAYSLGGPQVPEKYRDQISSWQEVILGIAKEEMGHFVSVQNVLKLIGGPLHFERQDYPWDTPFYPFPFKLEALTLNSLAKYVYAEAPVSFINSDDPLAKEIKDRVNAEVPKANTVGALFHVLLQLIQDPEVISDEIFQADTYPFQAKFDEWGRGYKGGQRGNTKKGSPAGSPDVLVMPLASRDDAYNALNAIAEQGEDNTVESAEPSHFIRFLNVYKEMRDVVHEANGAWTPARNVAVNPYIPDDVEDGSTDPSEGQTADEERDKITNPEAQNWGHLFNLRYRMLLNFLTHSFVLEDGLNSAGAITPRGLIINSTFGEMYNLRSIATVLVQLPLNVGTGNKTAGPPFLIPYTLSLPSGEHNRWRTHADLIQASAKMIHTLLVTTPEKNHRYLYALHEADNKLLQIINDMLQINA